VFREEFAKIGLTSLFYRYLKWYTLVINIFYIEYMNTADFLIDAVLFEEKGESLIVQLKGYII